MGSRFCASDVPITENYLDYLGGLAGAEFWDPSTGDTLPTPDTGQSLPSIFWGRANVSIHRKCLPVEGSTRPATAQL